MVSIQQSKYYEYYSESLNVKNAKELERRVQQVKEIQRVFDKNKNKRRVDVRL